MNKLVIMLVGGIGCFLSNCAIAQETSDNRKKIPVYGSVAIGYGNTFFQGFLGDKETINDERGFGRNDGYSFSTFYYWAPESFKGLGLGTGVKGMIARPNEGDNDETYSYNYYAVGISVKDYFISKKFNQGFAVKAGIGYGPANERMKFGGTNTYDFQNANGFAFSGGCGYAIPFKKSNSAITVEFDYEYSNRNARITGEPNTVDFITHHVSINAGITF